MSKSLMENLRPEHWGKGQDGYNRMRWLQSVTDLFNRPVINRANNSTNATAINCTGNVLSSGVGAGPIQPKRYGEFTVKARVTFNINSVGPAYVYVYRTTGNVPANGAAPNGGDVIVGGDSFIGGATVNGQNLSGSFSFLDTGLNVNQAYRYYLAVKGPNATVLNLVLASQLLVMERS